MTQLRHSNQKKQKNPVYSNPCLLYTTELSNPPIYNPPPPPDNLGPKSSIFLTEMGLICPLYNLLDNNAKGGHKKETHELYTNTIALLTVNTFNLIDIIKVFH